MNALKRRLNLIKFSDNIENDFKQTINNMDTKITEIAKKKKMLIYKKFFYNW